VSNEVTWVIRHINNEGVQTGIQDLPKVWLAETTSLWLVTKKPLRGKRPRSIEEVSTEVTWVIRRINNEGVQTGLQDFPKRWTAVIKHNEDYVEGL
jgi:hypothetical protein